MEFLDGKGNEILKERVEVLLTHFEKRLKILEGEEEVRFQWERLLEIGSYPQCVQFLRNLLQKNLPLCATLLDNLLPTVDNPLEYLGFLSLRMKVAMSLENFPKARQLALKQYDILKAIIAEENSEILPEYLYKPLFRCCLDNISICRYQGHLVDAKNYLDEALEISNKAGKMEDYHLARVFYADWLLAKGLLNTAIEEVLHPLLEQNEISDVTKGHLLQKLGNACRSAALWDKAKEHLKESITIAQRTKDEIAEYDRAADLGNVYRSEGRIADAIDMQSKHMTFAFERGDFWGLSVACFNMGFSYYSITPEPKLEKAMVLLIVKYILSKRMDNEPLRGIALNNIGKTFCALKQYEMAIKVIGECVQVAKATGNIAGEGMALGNLGTAYRFMGEFEQAVKHHFAYRDNADGRGDDGGKAIMQRELSMDYMMNGDLENAEKYIKDAILTLEEIRMNVGQEDTSKLANFDKNQAESYNHLQVILVKRGKIKEALALSEFARGRAISDIIRNKNIDKKNEDWLWNDDIIKRSKLDLSLTNSIIDDFYKTADQLNSSFLVYSIITDYNHVGKPEKWIYCWVVKCLSDLKPHEDRVSFNKSFLDDQMPRNNLVRDDKFFSSLCRSFGLANIAVKDFKDLWETKKKSNHLNDSDTSNSVSVNYPEGLEIEKFINVLKEMELLEIASTEGKLNKLENSRDASKLAEVKIENKNEIEYRATPVSKNEDMPRVHLRGNWEEDGQKQLELLYSICIAPIEHLLPPLTKNRVPRLIILPHEFLFSVPFCALPNTRGTYFVERYCLSYAPSLRALMMLNMRLLALKQKQGMRPPKVLSVGNPSTVYEQLDKLSSATVEAYNIQRIFGTGNCHVAVEKEATKETVLEMLQECDVVHLATHAYPEDPETDEEGELSVKAGDYLMRGFVALAPSNSACKGLLLAREIVSVPKCDCQLVTLSCCETGLGKVTGDGVVGLYRAFIAAGSAGVIVTLWKIRDDVTPPFMEKFYASYKENGDIPLALRTAMLYCLKENKLHPSQWAAFSYIGSSHTDSYN